MYLSWMDSTSHTPFIFPPEWKEKNHRNYIQNEDSWAPINEWLNSVRWTDDIIKEIILGFRERGLEEETLFLMYVIIAVGLIVATEITDFLSLGNTAPQLTIPITSHIEYRC
jgi:hypothetical protein